MDVYTIKTVIMKECFDTNGFLVLLHSHSNFDQEKYQKLIFNITEYATFLGSNESIDRSIASCLFELMTTITFCAVLEAHGSNAAIRPADYFLRLFFQQEFQPFRFQRTLQHLR